MISLLGKGKENGSNLNPVPERASRQPKISATGPDKFIPSIAVREVKDEGTFIYLVNPVSKTRRLMIFSAVERS